MEGNEKAAELESGRCNLTLERSMDITMKRWIGMLFLALVFCAGCQKEAEQTEPVADWTSGYLGMSVTYGPQGSFYTESNFLHFLDPKSGMDSLICDNIECSHSRSACAAYFDGMVGASIEGDHLLLLTTYGGSSMTDYYLYEASLNGENRKKIASLREMQLIWEVAFTERYVIVSFWNSFDENYQPLDEDIAGIYVYDKEAKEGKTIWEMQKLQARVLAFTCVGDEIYFVPFFVDLSIEDALAHEEDMDYIDQHIRTEFCKMGIDGERLQVIDRDLEEPMGLSQSDGSVFGCFRGQCYQYDTATGEYTVLSEKPLVPCLTFLSNEMILECYIGNEQREYYAYSKKDGLRLLGTTERCTVSSVFPEYVYVTDYATPTGYGVRAYYTTEDFLKGKLENIKHYEKLEY